MLKRSQVPVAKADIGPVNRRDIIEAKAIKENDRHLGKLSIYRLQKLNRTQEKEYI